MNKRTWLCYLDGIPWDSVYERTMEEAEAAFRATNSFPEDGGELYPGDSPMTLTIESLE